MVALALVVMRLILEQGMFLPWTEPKSEDVEYGNLPDIVAEAIEGQILVEQWNKQKDEVRLAHAGVVGR